LVGSRQNVDRFYLDGGELKTVNWTYAVHVRRKISSR